VHHQVGTWEKILADCPMGTSILQWIRAKVKIKDFVRYFRGNFQDTYNYDCDFPPSVQFRNHASCTKFSKVIADTILKPVSMGAFRVYRVWGE
jgi:hypothetical protein